jgi:hypothetical protein
MHHSVAFRRLPLLASVIGSLCLAVYLGMNEYKAVKTGLEGAPGASAQISTAACTNGIDDDRDGRVDYADKGCTKTNGGSEIDALGVGINLDAVRYYSTELPFIDSMKYVSGIESSGAIWSANKSWHCTSAGSAAPVTLSPTGWPVGTEPMYCTVTHVHVPNTAWPEGRFWLRYEGTGQVQIGNLPVQTFSTPNTWTQTNRLTGGNGISVRILNSNPDDPVRNIRLIPDGTRTSGLKNHEAYQLFLDNPTNPEYWQYQFTEKFLELAAPFAWLRFMDSLNTNQNAAKTIDDILPPDYSTYGGRGDGTRPTEWPPLLPWIQLCNVMKQRYSDFQGCWLNMPPEMDNAGYQHLARIVRDNLDPRLEAYIEYGNEVWNYASGFWHTWNYVEQYRISQGITGGWPFEEAWARLAGNMFNQFTAVWNEQPDPSKKPKLMRVAAGQYSFVTRSIAFFERLKNYTVDGKFEVISGAPYFAGSSSKTASAETITNALLVYLYKWKGKQVEYSTIREQLSQQFGFYVKQIEYEGGSHDVDKDNMIAAHSSPAMYKVYRAYLQRLADSGYDGMTLYKFAQAWSVRFAWGHLQTIMKDDISVAYKYNAIKDFVAEQKAFVANGTKTSDWLPPVIQTWEHTPGLNSITITLTTSEPSKYSYRYWKIDQGTGSFIQGPNSLSLNHTFTISNLSENTEYKFDVWSEDAAGNIGPLFDVTTVYTLSSAPVLDMRFESLENGAYPEASGFTGPATITGNATLSDDVPPKLVGKSLKSARIAAESTPQTYLRIKNHGRLNPRNGFTISMWIKRNTSFFRSALFSKQWEAELKSLQYELTLPSDGKVELVMYQRDKTRVVVKAPTALLPLGGPWRHIAAVADPDQRKIRLFADGVLVAETPYDGTVSVFTPGDVGVGMRFFGGSTSYLGFNGYMDDVRFYNRGLSPADITELANGREPLQGAAGSSSSRAAGSAASSSSSSRSTGSSSSSVGSLASACITMTDSDSWNLHRNAPVSVTLKQGSTDVFTVNGTSDANGKVTVSHASLGSLVTASNYSIAVHPRGYQKTTLTNLTNVQVLSSTCPAATIKFGDFNADGSLTVADLLKLLQFLKNGDDAQVQAVFGSIAARLVDLVKLIRLMNN